MSITGFLCGRYRQLAAACVKRRLLWQAGPDRLDQADWSRSLAMLARLQGGPCRVEGSSPFSQAGDAVSSYRKDFD
jgi:hypothetical protein